MSCPGLEQYFPHLFIGRVKQVIGKPDGMGDLSCFSAT
jgi:hypothetical protein